MTSDPSSAPASAQGSAPPAATPAPAEILAAAVAKGLIDQDLARTVAAESTRSGRSSTAILVERGILTEHIVATIVRDIARSRGPRTVGGYRLVAEIGHGGMGVVYRAVQLSVGREVALKLMRASDGTGASSMGSDEYAERFLHEARTAASVNHPQVVTLFDAGRDGDDLYLVMELVVGGDAARLRMVHGGRLPPRRALEIVRDAAKGLAAIHRVSLIHRDIKPANIFIAEDGGAKLADLGLARRAGDDAHLTITGAILGTPAYMAPEQAEGLPIDIRADIYALGATLYALVTGQDPYQGATAMAVAAKAIAGPFPDPRAVVPGLPQPVIDLITRATAHDRDARFAEPADVVAACDAALTTLPSPLGVPSTSLPRGNPPFLGAPSPSSARVNPVLSSSVPAPSGAPSSVIHAVPLEPPRRTSWTLPILITVTAAALVATATWYVVDGMDRDQARDALLATISAIPDHAPPSDEVSTAAAVATYDHSADDQRRASVDAAWSARKQAIDHARAADADALRAAIADIALDATPVEERRVDSRLADFARYADPTVLAAITDAWSARKTDIQNAKSTALIAAIATVADDADPTVTDKNLAAFQARITALGNDGVPLAPMHAALDQRRTAIAVARAAAAQRAADDAASQAATAAAAASETARLQRQKAIDDVLADLDKTIADAQAAMRDAAQRADRFAAVDDPQIRDDLHDYYSARRATWDGYVAHLAGDADLATVTAAAATIRDRRNADPAAAEAALANALPLAHGLGDHLAALRRAADDGLVAWCWDRELAGKPAALAAAAADIPGLSDLLAPRLTTLRKHLAVLDSPCPIPADAATAIAVIAQLVPHDTDAARWQAKLDEVGHLRLALAPLDLPGLPTPDERAAVARLAALVGPDDAQAKRGQARLARIDGLAADLAQLEAWPPPTADDLARLRGDETAWESLTRDATSAATAVHRALLVDPLLAADEVAVLTVSAADGANSATTLRLLAHGDVLRLARYDAAGALLCWYRLTIHPVGDGWHLLPAADPAVGGTHAAEFPPVSLLLPGHPGPGALLWRANAADCPADLTAIAADRLPPCQRGARTVAALVAAPPTAAGRPADGRPAWAADFGNDAYGPWADLAVPSANAAVVQRLRLLPPGTFTMGSAATEAGRGRDEIQHAVTFTKSLWLADSPCTQALWQAVMATSPSRFHGDPQRPVEQVAWQDCADFCTTLSRRGDLSARLPTESEWEYAARAGAAPEANAPETLATVAWYNGDADGATHAVRGKHANPWGFYDLLGNVREWCGDWYGPYPGAVADPTGAAAPPTNTDPRHQLPARRCVRGGSWLDGPSACRPAARDADTPDFAFHAVGFRFAITVP